MILISIKKYHYHITIFLQRRIFIIPNNFFLLRRSLRSPPVHIEKILKIQRQRNSPRYILSIPFSSIQPMVHSSNYFHLSRPHHKARTSNLPSLPFLLSLEFFSLSGHRIRHIPLRKEGMKGEQKKARNKGEAVGAKDGDDEGVVGR